MNASELSADIQGDYGKVIFSYKGDILTSPAEVKGFSKLNEDHKKLFAEFLNNFYAAWEFPEKHLPKKIKYVADRIPYLRVDFKKGYWLHIISPTRWF